jgi:ribosomal protein S18 acetylase RimI-like enzyme
VELRPASEFTSSVLAEAFTTGYEGYQFPIQLDEAEFTAMAERSDFDLDRSQVALAGDGPVGICALGVRGDEGWIGGLGVALAVRRRGIGRQLMDAVLGAARAAGIARVSLEVLEANTGAIALYEQLGFERTRMLEVWSLTADPGGSGAEPATAREAAAWIRANRRAPEPWQRADESIRNLELEAVAVPGRGAALFRVTGEVASALQLAAADEETAAELLAAVRRRGSSLRFVNVPEGDPAGDALRRLGGTLDVRQLEMALELS